MDVVVVESPAKAKTINKYLGRNATVLASYGHVRDLPPKDGSVRPENDFEILYELGPDSKKHIDAIVKAMKTADRLILATDPDREGEAISWHVMTALNDRKALAGKTVKRVVFNQITERAVSEAMLSPRDLDMDLVNAQQARRALDYLVGFTLSPVLWRKLPGAKSAGRVQSVALRLVCEREAAIEAFRPREYWTVDAELASADGKAFQARLVRLDGEKLGKFSLPDKAAADRAVAALMGSTFQVASVETKETKRNPAPPFTTSTLQQEASRKLGMDAQRTMRVAQRLYEGLDLGGETVGLITYMRTDGLYMADDAIAEARKVIAGDFGAAYVPPDKRLYKSKQKNAQEAHEAIRPTSFVRRPKDLRDILDHDQLRLYELIWKRAIASQVASARLNKAVLEATDAHDKHTLRATGSIVVFDGFLRVYVEGRDDLKKAAPDEDADDDRQLPQLAVGQPLERRTVSPEQHFTEPPPRFTEATLVKKLEELGIGRPSTYAQILATLRDREYVRMDAKRFVPEDKGRLVNTFLVSFFERYFDYGFTANLENRLDEVTARQVDWKAVLREFWLDFTKADPEALISVKQAVDHMDKSMGDRGHVIEVINQVLADHFFPANDNPGNPRACPSCDTGILAIKFGKMGGFIGCSNYPDCRYTRPLTVATGAEDPDGLTPDKPRVLGTDADDEITLRKGPYGVYVQRGEKTDEVPKPPRVSIPKELTPDQVTFDLALKLLALPRTVGDHPETQKPIMAGIGRYGPYLQHDGKYTSLKTTEEVLTIGLNHAVTIIAEAAQRGGRRGPTVLRELGAHDGAQIKLLDGRYGPYVSDGKTNATLRKDDAQENLTLERALALIAEKAAKGGKTKKKAPAKKKTTAKKTAKKPPAKKAS